MTSYTAIFQKELGGTFSDIQTLEDKDGLSLEITLQNSIHLSFDYVAYRVTNEGDRLLTLNEVAASSTLGKILYEAADSEYIVWLTKERCGIEPPCGQKFRHFLVLTEFVIDIICYDAPTIAAARR